MAVYKVTATHSPNKLGTRKVSVLKITATNLEGAKKEARKTFPRGARITRVVKQ